MLSWPGWLTYSEWFSHISGHPSAAGRVQDTESSPDRRSTTVPCKLTQPNWWKLIGLTYSRLLYFFCFTL